MASFTKLGVNGRVLQVVSVSNDIIKDDNNIEQEQKGIDFLTELYQWPCWAQCSYNTSEGEHKLGGTPFRKNFPGVGWRYDDDRDAFIPPKPYPTWIIDEERCVWIPPVAKPDGDENYIWVEESQSWEQIDN